MSIFIIDIDPSTSKYAKEWNDHLPDELREATPYNVRVITGDNEGIDAPFNRKHCKSVIYRSVQTERLANLFCAERIKDGDHILFSNAWHPGAVSLKYMIDVAGLDVHMHGIWHNGGFDDKSPLGQKVGKEPWLCRAEQALYHTFDHNYFVTNSQVETFTTNRFHYSEAELIKTTGIKHSKIIRTGWPMGYLGENMSEFVGEEKRDLIVVPHKLLSEKQENIFHSLKKMLPEYELMICEDHDMSATDFYSMLSQAKMVFSASQMDTIDLVSYEGLLLGAMPYVPDRLSYKEMYTDRFRYPSEWTENHESFTKNMPQIVKSIKYMMDNFDDYQVPVERQRDAIKEKYFTPTQLLESLNGHYKP